MRDAIRSVRRAAERKGQAGQEGHPGGDRRERQRELVSLEALTRLAQQDDVLIYAIGLLTDEDKREAKKAQRALQLLTESTGGTVFYPKDVSEVDRIAHQVAHDIRNQYTIAYTPTNRRSMGRTGRSRWWSRLRGTPWRAPGAAITHTKDQQKIRPRTPSADVIRIAWRLLKGYRLRPWQQPLPEMAH